MCIIHCLYYLFHRRWRAEVYNRLWTLELFSTNIVFKSCTPYYWGVWLFSCLSTEYSTFNVTPNEQILQSNPATDISVKLQIETKNAEGGQYSGLTTYCYVLQSKFAKQVILSYVNMERKVEYWCLNYVCFVVLNWIPTDTMLQYYGL